MLRELLLDAENRMRGSVTSLESDLQSYRTGRATPHLLDRLEVEMYGANLPLNQIAAISVPEPQQHFQPGRCCLSWLGRLSNVSGVLRLDSRAGCTLPYLVLNIALL